MVRRQVLPARATDRSDQRSEIRAVTVTARVAGLLLSAPNLPSQNLSMAFNLIRLIINLKFGHHHSLSFLFVPIKIKQTSVTRRLHREAVLESTS